jgi:hypothetical protein
VREQSARLVGAAALALAVLAVGCAKKSPEEQVAELRAGYEAELNGFIVKSEPVAAPEPMTEGGAEEAAPEAAGAAAEGEGGLETPDVEELPVTSDVVLDIVVRTKNDEQLPGITLDVSQASAQGAEKNHWRIWVETSSLRKGPGTQISHVLEDVDYEQGDGFFVEVRQPVPPAERGEYKEFSPSS